MEDIKKYRLTTTSCFISYVVQAIVNNFIPLLFLTFQNTYQVSLSQITLLVTINFVTQLIIDLLSVFFVDKIGYKSSMILAHVLSAAGLILLPILPQLFTNHFIGIVISVLIYAIGGGLIEVVVSPLIDSCPFKNKEKSMSLLHSFYCFGHVGVVLVSTLFFFIFKIENWKILSYIWAILPLVNAVLFFFSPFPKIEKENKTGSKIIDLFKNKSFWLLFFMMLLAGACEQSISQWTSAFAENGLHISKTQGDLLGPMSFAILMGCSRLVFAKTSEKLNLDKFMFFSICLCIVSYLGASLLPVPMLNLIFCAICGFSVGILWPGCVSKASKDIPNGSTAMFSFLALGGDLGCTLGPTSVGLVSSALNDELKYGILIATVFPILLLVCFLLYNHFVKKKENENV